MVWFSDRDLRQQAGGRSYERGAGYLDAIADIGDLPDGVIATVHGSGAYRVRLRRHGGLSGECSCPYGQAGNFCKHCVAVGLHLLAAAPSAPGGGEAAAGGPDDVREYLASLTADELVDLIWHRACDDAVLYERLRLGAATARGSPDLRLLQGNVERLRRNWLGYEDTQTYVDGAEALLDALTGLLPEHARAVRPLLRRAVELIGATASASEDEAGVVTDAADVAWRRYLDACEIARPDPAELARWLLEFQLDGPDWPEVGITDVVDLLGDAGIAAYRAALDEAGRTRGGHWRLRWLREELTAATGDTDALVACLAEDLTGPHQYERIAGLLLGEDRTKEAAEWLERARDAGQHLGRRGDSLAGLLYDVYRAEGREDQILPVCQERFRAWPDQSTYGELRAAAQESRRWDALREEALALLRRKAETDGYVAADTLVRVLLDEDEVDAAWRVVQQHRCQDQTLLAVAERRAATHPADAITVHRPLTERAIARVDNQGYREAAEHLLVLRDLYARTGDDFAGYLATLRDTHRRKRNFLAELDRSGLR